MSNLKLAALSLTLAGSMFAASQASAVSINLGGAGGFKTTPVTVGIYTFTYISTAVGLAPGVPGGFPAVTATNLPDNIILSISSPIAGIGNFNITNSDILTALATEEYNLSYTVELYAGAPSSNPDERFQTIGLGANIDSQFPNAGAEKWIFGQNTVLVPAAKFQDALAVTFASNSDTSTCGICRKFVVTDILDTRLNPGGSEGLLNSVSNSYSTIQVPVPAPILLIGVGLLALRRSVSRRGTKG